MFEFVGIDNDLEFRYALRENPWLSKFLISYCFDESFIFFNERKMMSGMGIEKLKKGQYLKQQIVKHINSKREEMVGIPMHLQSFQYLIYIINKMRKSVRGHYSIVVPYLCQLDKEDVPYVVDIFMKKFALSKMQRNVLKGGI